MTIVVDDKEVRTEDEDESELEEGEIEQEPDLEEDEEIDSEEEYDDENEYADDDSILEYDDEDEDDLLLDGDEFDDDEGHDNSAAALDLMESVLTTEDGDTVASALVHIGRQLETQNKILIKIFAALQN